MALYPKTNYLLSNTKLKLSLLLSLLLAIFILPSQSNHADGLTQTKLTVYFQNRPSGPKATAVAIAGIPGQAWGFGNFGTAFSTDASMTEGLDKSSAQIGRGQGIMVTTAKDGSSLTLLLSIVFTNKEYNGSTLQLQGADHQFENRREVAVVGGTGKFRFARGYATFEAFRVGKSHVVSRCNVTVEHYNY